MIAGAAGRYSRSGGNLALAILPGALKSTTFLVIRHMCNSVLLFVKNQSVVSFMCYLLFKLRIATSKTGLSTAVRQGLDVLMLIRNVVTPWELCKGRLVFAISFFGSGAPSEY